MFRTTFLFLLCFFPTIGVAQCTGLNFWNSMTDPQQAELNALASATPFGQGNFWEATKGDTTLSILGTMHLPDARHSNILAHAATRLSRADLLLVEATLEDQAAMQAHMANNTDMMTLNDGTTLADHLSPDTWQAVRAAATDRGLPGFIAAKMQPWFLAMTLSIPRCAMAELATGFGGLDTMLMEGAASQSIPVAALEDWQDTFALITAGTFEEQIKALELSVMEPWLQDAVMVAVTDFYFAEDSVKAFYLTPYVVDFLPNVEREEFEAQFAQMTEDLLIDRNAKWIPVIEDAATRHDDIFIGFGAAHLFGEDGVLFLLEQNGWAITNIEIP